MHHSQSVDSLASPPSKLSNIPIRNTGTPPHPSVIAHRLKRDIEMTKSAHVDFGATFARINRRLYVAGIRVGSPAYCAGLYIGDWICRYGSNEGSRAEPEQVSRYLLATKDITLELVDKELITCHELPCPLPADLGMVYNSGHLVSVRPGSIAHRVHIQPGWAIVGVDGDDLLGLSDAEVMARLKRAQAKREGSVLVDCMDDVTASALVAARCPQPVARASLLSLPRLSLTQTLSPRASTDSSPSITPRASANQPTTHLNTPTTPRNFSHSMDEFLGHGFTPAPRLARRSTESPLVQPPQLQTHPQTGLSNFQEMSTSELSNLQSQTPTHSPNQHASPSGNMIQSSNQFNSSFYFSESASELQQTPQTRHNPPPPPTLFSQGRTAGLENVVLGCLTLGLTPMARQNTNFSSESAGAGRGISNLANCGRRELGSSSDSSNPSSGQQSPTQGTGARRSAGQTAWPMHKPLTQQQTRGGAHLPTSV